MGIWGLTTLVQEQILPSQPWTPIPAGTRLLVDGCGWAYYLLDHDEPPMPPTATPDNSSAVESSVDTTETGCVIPGAPCLASSPATPHSPTAAPLRRDHGGDYAALAARAEGAVAAIRRTGLALEVWWDAPAPPSQPLKARTSALRHAQYEAAVARLHLACTDDVPYPQGDLPHPPLLRAQLQATLRGLGVPQVLCPDEADVALARESAEAAAVVYARDSDFLLLRGARYVPFGALRCPAAGEASAVCLSRQCLAAALQTSEALLVEWALLLGNDYTGPFPREDFARAGPDGAPVPLDPGLQRARDPLRLLRALERSAPVRLCSANPGLAAALRYSRALYALEPLPETDGSAAPPRPPKAALYGLDEAAVLAASPLPSEGATGRHVVRLLLGSPGELPATAGPDAALHREAFQRMLDGRRCRACPAKLDWRDVEAAMRYQWLCHQHLFTEAAPPGETPRLPPPTSLFHGPTFHALAQEARRRQERAAPGPAPPDVDDAAAACEPLPVDAHRQEILSHVARHRVTLVQGETGCGKSSRVPLMLLEADPTVRMFVAQPRRLAAKALKDRVGALHGPAVGLRLGHGVCEGDRRARVWFATVGYLQQLAAHHPEAFGTHTHLIIDEVHDRSVALDLLCYHVRGLLRRYPGLRLVLMSATMCLDVLCAYFAVPPRPVSVGGRRFPVQIRYLQDLGAAPVPALVRQLGAKLQAALADCGPPPGMVGWAVTNQQLTLAFHLARALSRPGQAVLVFVSGIVDMNALRELFERVQAPHELHMIHAELPFDTQAEALRGAPGARRVVVATNAAESSITIPDCRHVICLGCAKQAVYSAEHHVAKLVPMWVSQANAAQRAGRVGRVRPGCVWRLYDEATFAAMAPFGPPEVETTLPEATLLHVRAAVQQPVTEVLAELPTPPDPALVQHAFDALHALRFLTLPSDSGRLTPQGTLAARLGIDPRLARLVVYGVRLGVAPEAAAVAAALAHQRTPFERASFHVHSPAEVAAILRRTLKGQEHFDAGLCSAPLMVLRVLAWWRGPAGGLPPAERDEACRRWGLLPGQLGLLDAAAEEIAARLGPGLVAPDAPLRDVLDRPDVVQRLRLALVWSFRHHLFQRRVEGPPKGGPSAEELEVRGAAVTRHQLARLLGDGVPFELRDLPQGPGAAGPRAAVQVIRFPAAAPRGPGAPEPRPHVRGVPAGVRLLLSLQECSLGRQIRLPAERPGGNGAPRRPAPDGGGWTVVGGRPRGPFEARDGPGADQPPETSVFTVKLRHKAPVEFAGTGWAQGADPLRCAGLLDGQSLAHACLPGPPAVAYGVAGSCVISQKESRGGQVGDWAILGNVTFPLPGPAWMAMALASVGEARLPGGAPLTPTQRRVARDVRTCLRGLDSEPLAPSGALVGLCQRFGLAAAGHCVDGGGSPGAESAAARSSGNAWEPVSARSSGPGHVLQALLHDLKATPRPTAQAAGDAVCRATAADSTGDVEGLLRACGWTGVRFESRGAWERFVRALEEHCAALGLAQAAPSTGHGVMGPPADGEPRGTQPNAKAVETLGDVQAALCSVLLHSAALPVPLSRLAIGLTEQMPEATAILKQHGYGRGGAKKFKHFVEMTLRQHCDQLGHVSLQILDSVPVLVPNPESPLQGKAESKQECGRSSDGDSGLAPSTLPSASPQAECQCRPVVFRGPGFAILEPDIFLDLRQVTAAGLQPPTEGDTVTFTKEWHKTRRDNWRVTCVLDVQPLQPVPKSADAASSGPCEAAAVAAPPSPGAAAAATTSAHTQDLTGFRCTRPVIQSASTYWVLDPDIHLDVLLLGTTGLRTLEEGDMVTCDTVPQVQGNCNWRATHILHVEHLQKTVSSRPSANPLPSHPLTGLGIAKTADKQPPKPMRNAGEQARVVARLQQKLQSGPKTVTGLRAFLGNPAEGGCREDFPGTPLSL